MPISIRARVYIHVLTCASRLAQRARSTAGPGACGGPRSSPAPSGHPEQRQASPPRSSSTSDARSECPTRPAS
eukprot:9454008-Pyramimonas_sp.AAC.1